MIIVHRYSYVTQSRLLEIDTKLIKLIRLPKNSRHSLWNSVIELNDVDDSKIFCIETPEEIKRLIEIETFNNSFEEKLKCIL